MKCTYPVIKGGRQAIIELDGKIIAHRKFKDLEQATTWTSAFSEGFYKREELKC